MGNNLDNFQLYRITTSEDIAKSLGGYVLRLVTLWIIAKYKFIAKYKSSSITDILSIIHTFKYATLMFNTYVLGLALRYECQLVPDVYYERRLIRCSDLRYTNDIVRVASSEVELQEIVT